MIDDQQKVIYSLKKITTRFDRLFRVYGKISACRSCRRLRSFDVASNPTVPPKSVITVLRCLITKVRIGIFQLPRSKDRSLRQLLREWGRSFDLTLNPDGIPQWVITHLLHQTGTNRVHNDVSSNHFQIFFAAHSAIMVAPLPDRSVTIDGLAAA